MKLLLKRFLAAVFLVWLLVGSAGYAAIPAETSTVREESLILRRDYLDAYHAFLCAAACMGTYDPKNSEEFNYLRDYGWEVVPFFNDGGKVEANFIIAGKTIPETGKKMYIIAFRGSKSKKDWQADFRAGFVPFGGSNFLESEVIAKKTAGNSSVPQVHRGFNEYTNLVMKTMLDTDRNGDYETPMWKLINKEHEGNLLITGHSLGGAVATMLGARLAAYGVDPRSFTVITFGAPAIGNAAFAKAYGDSFRLIRATNSADPVPGGLQTIFGGYKLFGQHVRYSVPVTWSDSMHAINLYFDNSVKAFYAAEKAAIEGGVIKPHPSKEIRDASLPIVAVWHTKSKNVAKKRLIPNVTRFVLDEYRMMLPNYEMMDGAIDQEKDAKPMKYYFDKAQAAGARYILFVSVDGRILNDRERWYLELGQLLVDVKTRQVIDADTFARYASPISGNIKSSIVVSRQARRDLHERFSWIRETCNESLID